MSADNWTICPQCLSAAQAAYGSQEASTMALYGSIPVAEFDAKRAALTPPDPEKYRTFREDYEFYGADSGTVTADYSGHCSECGIGVDFRESRRFWEPTSPPTERTQDGD